MTPYWRTVLVEMQRGLARRMVRVLALLFVLAFAVGAFFNFRADSANTQQAGEDFPVIVEPGPDPTPGALDLVELWPEDQHEPILAIPTVFLIMASLVIGASLVGAEWRAGTVTTNLTWEPRRVRLATAKFAGAAIVAFGFTLVLQLVFVALLLPNIAVNGSFEAADAGWFGWFAEGLLRGSLLAGIVAAAAATLAMLGRNTTVAIAAGFLLVSIVEPILRVWKSWADQWLVTTNAARVYFNDATPLDDGTLLSTGRAVTVTLVYLAVLAFVATWLFARRDVVSVS